MEKFMSILDSSSGGLFGGLFGIAKVLLEYRQEGKRAKNKAELLKLQGELDVKMAGVELQRLDKEADISADLAANELAIQRGLVAQAEAQRPVAPWVATWSAAIRPMVATVSMILLLIMLLAGWFSDVAFTPEQKTKNLELFYEIAHAVIMFYFVVRVNNKNR